MKFKSLLLAAAVTAATFSGVANAAIDGIAATGDNAINSDLVFFIYDTANDLSYVQNLDVNYKTMITPTPGSFSGSFNLDASKLNIFSASNSANLVWGMSATGFDYTDPDGSQLGFISNRAFPAGQDINLIGAMNNTFNTFGKAINFFSPIGTADALSATGASASLLSSAVKDFAAFDQAANVSATQNLWFIHTDAAYELGIQELASANPWVLNLTTNTVSSAGTVAPVPLPAAAWLMFSALMGLGGIARRRNAKV